MSSIEDTLYFISKQICIYIGLFILIAGLICNILNIAVFTQLTIFRRNQSAFYFISGSIVDCIDILVPLTFRISTCALGYDTAMTSVVWCKIRPAVAQASALISTTTVCFSAIDQYLSTSHYARLRQLSTLKLAQRLTFIIICFASLHAIPFVIFYGVVPNLGCIPLNPTFIKYVSFVLFCIFIGLLPMTISSIFAVLAYLNVRRIIRRQVPIIRRRLDRQLTAMVLIRVCLFIITILPFIVFQIYQLNAPFNPNNTLRIAIEQFISGIIFPIYFINYSSSFYVFLASSARFRRQVKYFLFKKLYRQCCLKRDTVRHNQIVPMLHISTVEMD